MSSQLAENDKSAFKKSLIAAASSDSIDVHQASLQQLLVMSTTGLLLGDSKFFRLQGMLAELAGWYGKLLGPKQLWSQLQLGLKIAATAESSGLDAWFDDLDSRYAMFEEDREFLIPIDGMHMEIPELRVGTISFAKGTEKPNATSRGTTSGDVQATQIFGKHQAPAHHRPSLDQIRSKAYAVASAPGDDEIGTSLARRKIRRALDALQLANSLLYHADVRGSAVAGIRGELPTYMSAISSVSNRGSTFSVGWIHDLACPLIIDSAFRRQLRSAGFGELAVLLETDKRNELEVNIIRGVHWFAEGTRHPWPDQAIVNYVMALESVVPRNLGGGIAISLATGVERILRQCPHEDRDLVQFVQDMYRIRSDLVHGDSLTDDFVKCNRLKWVTANVIATLLRVLPVIKDDTGLRNSLTPAPQLDPFLPQSGGELNPTPVGFGLFLQMQRRRLNLITKDFARLFNHKRKNRFPSGVKLVQVTADDIERWERQPTVDSLKTADIIAEIAGIPFSDIPFGPYERVLSFSHGRVHLKAFGDTEWIAKIVERPANLLPTDSRVAARIQRLNKSLYDITAEGSTPESALDALEALVRPKFAKVSHLYEQSNGEDHLFL